MWRCRNTRLTLTALETVSANMLVPVSHIRFRHLDVFNLLSFIVMLTCKQVPDSCRDCWSHRHDKRMKELHMASPKLRESICFWMLTEKEPSNFDW